MTVVAFRPALYTAKMFRAHTVHGQWKSAGTLCGHIDFCGPFQGTYQLSPDEALAVIVMLKQAREDVLANSDPIHDPRIVER